MAIIVTNVLYNKTIYNGVASTTLVFPSTTAVIHCDLIVRIAMATDTESVSTITDTAGNTYYHRFSSQGTGVRAEIWEAQDALASGSNVCTVTFTGSVLGCASWTQYSNIVPEPSPPTTTQDMASAYGRSALAGSGTAVQEVGNWVVAALAYKWEAGLGYTVTSGTLRDSIVPAVTGGVALVDVDTNGPGEAHTTNPLWITLTTTEYWASLALELRGGGASVGSPPVEPVDPSNATVTWVFSYVVTTPGTYGPPSEATVVCSFRARAAVHRAAAGNTGH
jgi:hypothetical protein